MNPATKTPKIPGYKIQALLGEGGYGRVYRALRIQAPRVVAIKVLSEDRREDPADRLRFQREVEILRDHPAPGIPPLIDFDLTGSPPYFVTPYFQGGDLLDWVTREGPLSPDEIRRLALRLTQALASLHDAGILHRDIKPPNILLGPEQEAYLGDLGLGKAELDCTLTQTGHVVGTPAYLAPELFEGADATPASDLYSLGGTLYFAWTQKTYLDPRFLGPHEEDPWAAIPPGDEDLEGILRWMLRFFPKDRPASAQALSQALTEPRASPRFGATEETLAEVSLPLPGSSPGPKEAVPDAIPGSEPGPSKSRASAWLGLLGILVLGWLWVGGSARSAWTPGGLLLEQPIRRILRLGSLVAVETENSKVWLVLGARVHPFAGRFLELEGGDLSRAKPLLESFSKQEVSSPLGTPGERLLGLHFEEGSTLGLLRVPLESTLQAKFSLVRWRPTGRELVAEFRGSHEARVSLAGLGSTRVTLLQQPGSAVLVWWGEPGEEPLVREFSGPPRFKLLGLGPEGRAVLREVRDPGEPRGRVLWVPSRGEIRSHLAPEEVVASFGEGLLVRSQGKLSWARWSEPG